MTQILLPRQLYCPFPSLINAGVADADSHTANWLQHFGLVKNKEHLEKYMDQGFAWMVSRMFPNAEIDVLCAFTDLNTLLFLLDDYFDHIPPQATSEGDRDKNVRWLIDGFNQMLAAPEGSPPTGHPVLDALAELWGRIRKVSTESWQINFRKSISDIFRAAIWQHKNVSAHKTPSVRQYMAYRQYLGAANIATDTIAVADHIDLPKYVWESSHLTELTRLCRDTVCWANDLFSLSKELDHGDYHNLVVLLAGSKKIALHEAIEAVVNLHDDQVQQFEVLAGQTKQVPLRHAKEAARYIEGLRSIMRANIDWSDHETTRYHYDYAYVKPSLHRRHHYLSQASA